MKIVADAEELESMAGLSDAELAKLVRAGMAKFRGKSAGTEAEDDAEDPTASEREGTLRATEDDTEDPPASTGGARHGAPSTSTLETPGSLRGNVNLFPGARDSAVQATLDAARQRAEANLSQEARDAEAAAIIPGYRRL